MNPLIVGLVNNKYNWLCFYLTSILPYNIQNISSMSQMKWLRRHLCIFLF
jgi:hypothetical protein